MNATIVYKQLDFINCNLGKFSKALVIFNNCVVIIIFFKPIYVYTSIIISIIYTYNKYNVFKSINSTKTKQKSKILNLI